MFRARARVCPSLESIGPLNVGLSPRDSHLAPTWTADVEVKFDPFLVVGARSNMCNALKVILFRWKDGVCAT